MGLVDGSADMQAYYLLSTNERLNKHFFDVNTTQHKKLQWLLATTVSPGIGKQYHKWLAGKKKEGNNNKSEKFLAEIYPYAKYDEIKLRLKEYKVFQIIYENIYISKSYLNRMLNYMDINSPKHLDMLGYDKKYRKDNNVFIKKHISII